MIITPDQLTTIRLDKGSHGNPDEGMCLMEAVAYLRGVPWTDRPSCVSPLLGDMGRSLNDLLPNDSRQLLIPLIPLLPGTAGDGLDNRRSYMAFDWLIRTYTSTWLDLAGLHDDAAKLRDHAEIVDVSSAALITVTICHAQENADATWAATWAAARAATWDATWAAARDAAWAATWAATRDATWDAARDAARAAARDAARAATWAAARDATWDATWAAARDAAWAAARDATWAAAWDAARDAAWAAAGDAARDAARDATWAALAPTVVTLQKSAIDLYRRMASISAS